MLHLVKKAHLERMPDVERLVNSLVESLPVRLDPQRSGLVVTLRQLKQRRLEAGSILPEVVAARQDKQALVGDVAERAQRRHALRCRGVVVGTRDWWCLLDEDHCYARLPAHQSHPVLKIMKKMKHLTKELKFTILNSFLH